MRKRKSVLIAMLVLELALLFAVDRFFVNDMREDIDQMGQELTVKGMPPEQISTITSTLSKVKSNVSNYVGLTIICLVGINTSLIKLNRGKESNDLW